MTKTIKIRCDYARNILLACAWLGVSLIPVYCIYLDQQTINSFDKQNDCHFNYFEGRKVCESVFEKNNYAYGLPVTRIATQDDFVSNIYWSIGTIIFIQIIGLLLLNLCKGWVKIECVTPKKSEQQNDEVVT